MTTKKDEVRSTVEALSVVDTLKLALEALEPLNYDRAFKDEIAAIREALAQSRSDDEQPAAIPQYITCPFCESQHVPGWLHDYNMDRMKKPAQRKPLTNEQIQYAFRTNSVVIDNGNAYMVAGKRAINIARAIEAAHGIGNKNDK